MHMVVFLVPDRSHFQYNCDNQRFVGAGQFGNGARCVRYHCTKATVEKRERACKDEEKEPVSDYNREQTQKGMGVGGILGFEFGSEPAADPFEVRDRSSEVMPIVQSVQKKRARKTSIDQVRRCPDRSCPPFTVAGS